MRIRHLAIVTPDPKKLADYYIDVFGMKYIQEPTGGSVRITDGYMELVLLSVEAVRTRYPEAQPGVHHWGFTISDEERDIVVDKLNRYGVTPKKFGVEEKILDSDGNEFDITTTVWDAPAIGAR